MTENNNTHVSIVRQVVYLELRLRSNRFHDRRKLVAEYIIFSFEK